MSWGPKEGDPFVEGFTLTRPPEAVCYWEIHPNYAIVKDAIERGKKRVVVSEPALGSNVTLVSLRTGVTPPIGDR